MSAYLLHQLHVVTMACWAEYLQIGGEPFGVFETDPYGRAEGFVRLLHEGNLKSVRHRYPNDKTDEDLPGGLWDPRVVTVGAKDFAYAKLLRPIEVVKLCEGYDYQSCEIPDYNITRPARLVERIRRGAIRLVPGYDEGPWELNRPEQIQRGQTPRISGVGR